MGVPWLVVFFVVITFVLAFTIELMAKQVNDAKIAPGISYFSRKFGRLKEIKRLHQSLFPNSWTRELFWALRIVQILLFAIIFIGVIMSYKQGLN